MNSEIVNYKGYFRNKIDFIEKRIYNKIDKLYS